MKESHKLSVYFAVSEAWLDPVPSVFPAPYPPPNRACVDGAGVGVVERWLSICLSSGTDSSPQDPMTCQDCSPASTIFASYR